MKVATPSTAATESSAPLQVSVSWLGTLEPRVSSTFKLSLVTTRPEECFTEPETGLVNATPELAAPGGGLVNTSWEAGQVRLIPELVTMSESALSVAVMESLLPEVPVM